MSAVAKLFATGRSQAVRLPKEFRFGGTEVFIRRNGKTGEVVLSPKPSSWSEFFTLADQAAVSEDFMTERQPLANHERALF